MLELLWFCFLCSALLHFWELLLTNPAIYFGPLSQGNPLYLPLSEIHYLHGYSVSHFIAHENQNWICKTGIHQFEKIYMMLLSASGSIIWWIRNVASFKLILYISLWLKSLFPLPPKFHFQRVILQEIIKSLFISQTILMYCTLRNPIAGIANSSWNHRI